MEFHEELRLARTRLNMKQSEVAKALGVDTSTYCGYETGKRSPDVDRIKKLAQILKTSADILLGTKKESQQEENLQKLSGKEVISKFVVAAGFIQEGQQLSEEDYKILNNVMDILETWFRQKGK